MGQEHSILLAIMIFLIFQNSPKQKNSLHQQYLKSVGLIEFVFFSAKKNIFRILHFSKGFPYCRIGSQSNCKSHCDIQYDM